MWFSWANIPGRKYKYFSTVNPTYSTEIGLGEPCPSCFYLQTSQPLWNSLMAHEDSVPRALIEPVGCHFWQRHTPVLFPPRHQESQNNFSHHFNSSTHTHTHTHTPNAFLSTQGSNFLKSFIYIFGYTTAGEDLSSPTRDGTHAPCSRSAES